MCWPMLGLCWPKSGLGGLPGAHPHPFLACRGPGAPGGGGLAKISGFWLPIYMLTRNFALASLAQVSSALRAGYSFKYSDPLVLCIS